MIKLYTEGDADVKFFTDYLDHLNAKGEITNRELFILENLKGIDEDITITLNKIQPTLEREEAEFLSVFIIDSDELFVERKDIFENNGINHFLIPQNNCNGELENILENIIAIENKSVLECWRQYENCLDKNGYTIPANKSKIYGYVEALVGTTKKEKKKIKESYRNYRNPGHFDLDSEYLNPLKDFLKSLKSPVK